MFFAFQVLQIIRRRAAEIHPDVVFTQDTFADKNLRKMQEEMNNNVPCSEFSLTKVNINQADSVTIFVNTQKFEVYNVDKEARLVLDQERRTKISFLAETRYVVLQATSKRSGEKILLSSYHGKWKKASSAVKDELIRDFLTFMELLAKKLDLKVILIGTDINREMKNFSSDSSPSISVFDFNYPDSCPSHCKRKSRPVIDYFLHSSALSPLHNSAKRFHEDEAILDHHPIHTVFQVFLHLIIIIFFSHIFLLKIRGEGRVRSENEDVVRRAPVLVEKPSTKSSKAAQRVSQVGKDNQINQPRRPKTSTANDIIPGAISASSHSEPQGRNSNKKSSGVTQPRRKESSADIPQKDIIPGLSLASTIPVKEKDSKASKEGRAQENFTRVSANKPFAQHPGSKMQQTKAQTSRKGEIVPGMLTMNQTSPSPITQRAFSTKAPCGQDPQNPPEESFSCDLCKKSFSSRQGLFIHFGK